MGRARAKIDLPTQVSAAEALWYDLQRWPAFVDGFHHVAKLEGDWPEAGARLLWDSTPAGRGRVVERVARYEVRSGQTVEVEDPKLTGTQTVSFTPNSEDAASSVTATGVAQERATLGVRTDRAAPLSPIAHTECPRE